jgi:signal transduction histidine kinase
MSTFSRPVLRALSGALQIALTFAVFALFNAVARMFEVEPGVSILFPATAAAIVCTTWFGPIAAIGVIAGTIATPWSAGAGFGSLFVSGVISAIEGLIPWIVFRFRRELQTDLRDMRSLVTFLVFGTVLNTGFSAVAGNLFVVAHPAGVRINGHEVFVWWLADFTAALLLAVPILAFAGALRSRVSGTDREPRAITNTLQIVTVIILLGFGASFAIRTTLLNSLESDRLEQQRLWSDAEETLNEMHANFLGAAFVDDHDRMALTKITAARANNDRYVADLTTIFSQAGAMPRAADLSRIASDTRAWFRNAERAVSMPGSPPAATQISAHATGALITSLQEDVDRANAKAWAIFAAKRTKLMFVSSTIDALVFAILVLASVTLLMRVSRPLAQIRKAIDAMGAGDPLDASRIDSPYLEFRSIAAALEHTSHELRDREIALRLQTERAITASRHKSEFLAKMSHELRTPLNSMIGFSELLAEQEGSIEPQRRLTFLGNVTTSARHLLHLINDLLDIARVESGKMKLELENVDLRLAIASTVASTSPLFARKKQELEVAMPDEPMVVRADLARIEQVLLNLLSNANKFSAEGQKVTIRSAAENGAWRIDVVDRGIGVNAADQRRIFDEFEQVYARGPNSTGSGLGLALAKRFVEMHGGEIGVESTPGNGAVFSVKLPRETAVR